ncbi:hemolysin III family protein, partial [Escherichia coli]|uniref:hemolysin III family protein n=1 Tax=Escherichia coli TaxID=562 RepID=UPI003FA573FC
MSSGPHHVSEAVGHALESVGESLAETLRDIKPKLRGWLHLGTAPLALAGGIVLVALSPDTTTRIGSIVFGFSALLLFTVSAIYHTGTWSPRTWAFLRRFDHSNVF